MAKVKTLRDVDGGKVYPITSTNAVLDPDGGNLSNWINTKVAAASTAAEAGREQRFTEAETARQTTFAGKEAARDTATSIITQEAARLTAVEGEVTELGSEVGILKVSKHFTVNSGNQFILTPSDKKLNGDVWMEIESKSLIAGTIAVGYYPKDSTSVAYKTFNTFNVGDELKVINKGETLDRIVIINVSTEGDITIKMTNKKFNSIDNRLSTIEDENININQTTTLSAQTGNQLIYKAESKGSISGDVYLKFNDITFVGGNIYVQYYNNIDASSTQTLAISQYKIGDMIKILSGNQVLYNIIANNVTSAGSVSVSIVKGWTSQLQSTENKLNSYLSKPIAYSCVTTDDKKQYVNLAILDVDVKSKVGDANIYIEHILRNANISGTVYNSVNLRLKKDDGTNYGGIFTSNQGGRGIEIIDISNNNYVEGKILVNWDVLPESYSCNLGTTTEINDLGKDNHIGIIDMYKHIEQIQSYSNIDKMYVLNGKVVCNNNHKNSSNVVAKYACVDMGADVTKVMCRFTTRGGSLALITTKRHTVSNVTDITAGSVHLVFTTAAVKVGVYAGSWSVTDYAYSTALNTNDETEYEVGFEFVGGNQLKLYMPDGSTNTVAVANADTYNGRYMIFEHYSTDTNAEITHLFARPSITGIFCAASGVLPLQDNFKREDGVLTVAPSGHSYRLFRNYVDTDGKYDMSNGVV